MNGNHEGTHGRKNLMKDTSKLLDNEDTDSEVGLVEEEKICQPIPHSDMNSSLPCCTLNHPAFSSIELQLCDDIYKPGTKVQQTVVTLNDNITPTAFRHVLEFLYTGQCCVADLEVLADVRRAAEVMGLTVLMFVATNILQKEDYLNKELEILFHASRKQRLRDLMVKEEVLSDVLFQVDDDTVAAHRALLIARCDVMFGMFSYNFLESSAKVIQFPGVCKDTFVALQEYLYTGQCPSLTGLDYIEVVELANRLCQTQLLALAEQFFINELLEAEEDGKDIVEDVLCLLEPAQLHNAHQLADWCLWYMASNYLKVYRRYSKILQNLAPQNQIYLSKHRWPPLWYIKELDYYEKCMLDLQREKPARACLQRQGSEESNDRGCLGFCGRGRRKLKCEPSPTVAV